MTEWAPVVYGRTLVADRWWRALPGELDPTHWAAKVVLDTVANGAGLTRLGAASAGERLYAPRLAFARGADGTLVGVACRARQLTEDLCEDEHGRELYCFVGWFTTEPAARGIPPQAAFDPGPGSWASKAYVEYAAPVWRTRAAKLSILPSKPGLAPWEAESAAGPSMNNSPDAPPAMPEKSARLKSPSPRHVMVFPDTVKTGLWQLADQLPAPFILVTGWQKLRLAPLDRITVLTAEDVLKHQSVERPVVPVVPVTAQQETVGDHGAVTEDKPTGTSDRRRGEAPAWKEPKNWLLSRLNPSRYADDREDDAWSRAAETDLTTSGQPVAPEQESRAPLPPVEPELPSRRGNKKLFEGLDDF